MTVFEANDRLKTTSILEEELWQLNPLYLALDLDKDDFCKIVDLIGKEKFIKKQGWYERLLGAEEELKTKEKYLAAKQRLLDIQSEENHLLEVVDSYERMRK
jgi:hypothetical protein